MRVLNQRLARVLCSVMLLTALAMLAGCGQRTITVPPVKPVAPVAPKPAPVQDQSLAGQAERAWAAGNMNEAERLYGILARNADTPAAVRPLAIERFVDAALKNRHGLAALDGLDRQRQANAAVTQDSKWQQKLGLALMQLPQSEAFRRASGAAEEGSMPLTLRAQAAGVALLTAPAENRVTWMENLNRLYQSADAAQKSTMERGLYALLTALPPAGLAALVDYSLPDTDHAFPWSVFLLEQARRERLRLPVATTASGVAAQERLNGGSGIFTDPALWNDAMSGALAGGTFSAATAMTPETSSVTFSSGCAVLTLPLSGNFAGVGSRVALGADLAKKRLAGQGINFDVRVLDTEKPDWIDQLAALPPQCVMVGGPLRPEAYAAAKGRNMPAQRAFFTFTSALDNDDEGRVAWRFFNSLDDQVSAMVRTAESAGVSTFGVLYPEENYGRRMAELFMSQAGSKVVKSESYNAEDPQSWNATMQRFVGGYMRGKTPVSSAQFQGLFMPDSWTKSASLIPFLFFHGEDRLLIMGTALWEQGINQTRLDPSNTTLVIFPGAWNSVTPSASASNLIAAATAGGQTADFWMALGYDFVRFASAMNQTTPPVADDVNRRLSQAAAMNWSMAPLVWTPAGRVSQQMFVFNPTPEGLVIATPDDLRQKLDLVKARYQRRMSTAQ